jgi:putative nucleotidyltransferase with HDIG domain
LIELASREGSSVSDLAAVIESDAALAIAVMRAANQPGGARGQVANVPDAIRSLEAAGVRAAVDEVRTYELFETGGRWKDLPARFRRHALATRHAVERVADLGGVVGRDELVLAALLHDVGRLVLVRLYDGYEELLGGAEVTPEERVEYERRELGIDHALVGGVLARRWGLPGLIAAAIERHHAEAPEDLAAAIRLADMIAHAHHGDAIAVQEIGAAASACGLSEAQLRRAVHEFPYAQTTRKRPREPSPLSGRETNALRGLAEGKVYREIAAEMGLSASTVRTHLHNVYRKIGVSDRAQAVLLARDRGWV